MRARFLRPALGIACPVGWLRCVVSAVLLLTAGFSLTVTAAPAAKIIGEAVEQAAKRSGKTLAPAARKAANQTAKKLATQYGDDVLKIVADGGLETLNQGLKHGDDFWHLARLRPAAARALALHADDLVPLAKRLGPTVLDLEVKTPGISRRLVATFGDDAIQRLAHAPATDLPRLVGYAQKADNPATAKMLLDYYGKASSGTAFLDHLSWKHIMSSGLSAAAIITAFQVSTGVREGLETTAENSPETFARTVDSLTAPVRLGLYALVAVLLLPLAGWSWRRFRRGQRADDEDAKANASNGHESDQAC
ncbi:MAG TPA: hypothetical protein PKY10_16235 [Lentisphaeria bacterium]|nr:hypothetical protein [Lentisphaeria bacterium]